MTIFSNKLKGDLFLRFLRIPDYSISGRGLFAKNKTVLVLAILLLIRFNAFGQTFVVSGSISDSSSGESLISATVYEESSNKWTVTNKYGYYSLRLSPGKKKISFSYVSFKTTVVEIDLNRDTILSISLKSDAVIDEVIITPKIISKNLLSSQMGSIELPVSKVNSMPFLLGETDVIKMLQLMPGVMSGMEGSSGLYVRGGGPDQNLILLDGVPVYNANHLFGFYSVFNSDAIQSVTLIKGDLPARYGGRLSSVLDIRMKEGNMKEFSGTASLGIISSKFAIEGPLIKDKTSFMFSARRSYADALTYPFQILMNTDNEKNFTGYYMYDINSKINHRVSDKSRLFMSIYSGKDKYFKNSRYYFSDTIRHFLSKSESKDELEWGNLTAALRWNYLFSNTFFSNLTLIFSRYNYQTNIENSDYSERPLKGIIDTSKSDFKNLYYSGIKDYGLKWDVEYTSLPGHYIRGGISNTIHNFSPGVKVFWNRGTINAEVDTTYGNKKVISNEFYLYAEDDFDIGSRIKVNMGIHYSNFSTEGAFYQSFEPRLSGRILLKENLSLKASFAKLTQYNHLLSNSTIGLMTDLWVPSTKLVRPQKAWQISTGIGYNINESLELTSEVYFKNMTGLITYSDGASYFNSASSWEEKIEVGSGKSYGLEIFLQKTKGKFTGWIGYTLSRSTRKFPAISFGREFPYTYDRRHDLSLVVSHRINDRIDVSGTWVLASGNAITLSEEKYLSYQGLQTMRLLRTWYFDRTELPTDQGIVDHYETRNNFRMPAYHRLDLGINFRKAKKHFDRVLGLGAYNVYNRLNAFYLYYTYEYVPAETKVLYKVTLLPIIPYIRYSITF